MDQSQIIALIQAAAARQGVDPAVLLQIARRESSLNPNDAASTSSAKGLFQLTKAGWKDYGQGDPFDPAANADAGARMTAANIAGLKASGYPISPANVYLAHFSGLGGARQVLGADPSARVVDVLGADVVKANPFLANMSISDMQAWADRKMADVGQTTSPAAAGGPVMPQPQPGALDQVAMGRAPSGSPVGGGAPFDLAAAMGGMPGGGSKGSPQLGMLANALGGFGGAAQQQAPQIKPSEMEMPIPVGMRGSLVASILARGGRA
jgi:transglycosylase-like protein with SLT domain